MLLYLYVTTDSLLVITGPTHSVYELHIQEFATVRVMFDQTVIRIIQHHTLQNISKRIRLMYNKLTILL